MSTHVNDLLDGYVGQKLQRIVNTQHRMSSQNTAIPMFKPNYKQYFNPLGINRVSTKTLAATQATGYDIAVDPYRKEGFDNGVGDNNTSKIALDTYMLILKARAVAVKDFCLHNNAYKPFIENWKLLESNLIKKNKLTFEQLDASDQDIAYVIDKGAKVCFRIHDQQRFMPINIYQYVLYHEMAHMSTTELQHTSLFHKLLNLLSLAAYELGFIDLQRITKQIYTSNGQGIASAECIQDEIILGCNHMIEANANNTALVNYYKDLRVHVSSRI